MSTTRPDPRPTTLTEEDLYTAWEILSPEGGSIMTKSQVLDSLKLYFPYISAREVRDLVGPGNLSLEKLRNLLFNTESYADYDPNVEAFRIIDPHGTGYVEMNVLRRLLSQIPGVDMIDEGDMELLHELVDVDKDGRISLRDFAQIGSWSPPKEVPPEQARRMLLDQLQRQDSS
mmetsp:Transcript_17372/g.37505  ORF Transcript_17372/g.37505 Transcript_17372/m.37505 type:complete len:174 (+) Transcript_17372:193-714(+)